MKEKCESQGGRKRRPYVKPAVKQVPLRPEEAVLGACKLAGTAGPVDSACNPAGSPCYTRTGS
jgi:hypothetical protein